MTSWKAKRFWTLAETFGIDGAFGVRLDRRELRTPAKTLLRVPTRAMAEAIAAEWNAQEGEIRPETMPVTRAANAALDKVSTQPFVSVARAKGASRSWVLLRHVARNALLPVLTIAGVLFGELLAGAVITETVFGLNGVGRLAERSVRFQDTAVLQAIVVIAAFGFVAINLIVDLLYPLLDPRLRRNARVPA